MSIAIGNIERWNIVHSSVLLLSSLEIILLRATSIMTVSALCSFLWFMKENALMVKSSHGQLNYANITTFIRFCLTLLISFFYTALSSSAIAITALVAILMDGLDGHLARRFKSSSTSGSYFDKETDAFYVCVMCSVIYLKGYLGTWILMIGFMRYAYVLLLFLLNISQKNDPSTRFAQVVAGILFCALITPFVMTENIYLPCILLSSLFLIISFSRSFVKTVFDG